MTGAASTTVSVVMPVRNAEDHLDDAIASVCEQTFADFEFVILDDGSTDASPAIIDRWAKRDPRIRVVRRDRPHGLVGSANAAVRQAAAPLVARMDADDVSEPDRLRRQVAVFRRVPDAVLVATLWRGIDAAGAVVRPRDRWSLLGAGKFPFCHGSVMVRRDAFEQVGGYRVECEGWEDLDLWLRLRRAGPVLVVPEALYRYRFHSASTTGGRADDHTIAVRRRVTTAVERTLRDGEPTTNGPTVDEDPATTVAALRFVGQTRLWAGARPRVASRIRGHLQRSLGVRSLFAYLLAVAGDASPTALRWVLAAGVRLRDLLATPLVARREAVRW